MSTFEEQQAALRTALVNATVLSNDLPAAQDINFHRSMSRPFAQDIDSVSATLLSMTNKVLYSVAAAQSESTRNQSKKRRRLDPTVPLIAGLDDVTEDFTNSVVDIVDWLFEKADSCFDEAKGLKKKALMQQMQMEASSQVSKTSGSAGSAKMGNQVTPNTTKGRLPASVLNASHIPKPQLNFLTPIDNERDVTWKPLLPHKPNALVPLDLTPTLADEEGSIPKILNPYRYEQSVILENLPQELFSSIPLDPTPQAADSFESTPFQYVDTLPQFSSLLEHLKTAKTIAVDLEHHDFRTYTGLVCLIQISIPGMDFVIDALNPEVRQELYRLNETFTDPQIVKVFHGAERDIIWLQRDCGVYVVGLFDTFHASKALGLPANSLASLLEKYCGFEADKRYQLADWRNRPLPSEMLHYARSDTHYLLFIYQTLLIALHTLPPNETHSILQTVFLKSAKTASQSYTPLQYESQTGNNSIGWRSIVQKWGKCSQYNVAPHPHLYSLPTHKGDLEFHVFRAVHDWRDQVAREEDESPRFVMPHHVLFKLAEKRPSTVAEVLACVSPVSSVVVKRKSELARLIKASVEEWEDRPDVKVVEVVETPVVEQSVMAPAPIVSTDLWQKAPLNVVAQKSAMFGDAPVPASLSSLEAPGSALFTNKSRRTANLDTRYAEILQSVHKSLSLALSLAMTSGLPSTNAGSEASTSHTFVPAAERQTETAPIVAFTEPVPIASTSASTIDEDDEPPTPPVGPDDNEVITISKLSKAERKKLKRSKPDEAAQVDGESPRKKKKKSKKVNGVEDPQARLAPHDYSKEVSILDQAPPSVPAVKREKKQKPKKEGKSDTPKPFMRPKDNANTSKGERSLTFVK